MSEWTKLFKNVDNKKVNDIKVISKKKDDIIVKESKKEKKIVYPKYINEDEEFNSLYADNMFNITNEIDEHIKICGFPFNNNKKNFNYSLYDFIKNNSKEFYNICANFDNEETDEDSDSEYESDY